MKKYLVENIFDEVTSDEYDLIDGKKIDIFDDYDFKIRFDYIYPDYKDKEEYVLDRFEQLFSQADNVYDFLIEEDHGYIIYVIGYLTNKEVMVLIKYLKEYVDEPNIYMADDSVITLYDNNIMSALTSSNRFNNFYMKLKHELETQKTSTLDLTKINVSGMETISFHPVGNYSRYSKIDITGWDTSKCKYLSFANLVYVDEIIGIEDLDTSSLESAEYMFADCGDLKKLDLSKWDFSRVKKCNYMFYWCRELKELMLPDNFMNEKVNEAESAFECCTKLLKLDVSKWNPINLRNASKMFQTCGEEGCEFIGFEKLKFPKLTNATQMFHLSKIDRIDMRNWDFGKVLSTYNMFSECSFLKEVNMDGLQTQHLVEMTSMFYKCRSLQIVSAENMFVDKVIHMSCMFKDCKELHTVNISSWRPVSVRDKNMREMFRHSLRVKNIDLSNWVIDKSVKWYTMENSNKVMDEFNKIKTADL